ncbi:MAG: SDR family oxidoreductase [Planctomycetota bacterium]
MTDGGIVVTGASSGIGRAIALRLAADAMESVVVLHYATNRSGVEQTADQIRAGGNPNVVIIQADLTEPSAVESLAGEAFDVAGDIQTWVNNAGADVLTGVTRGWSFDQKLRHLLNVDLIGTIALSRIVGERLSTQSDLPRRPSMVFIGWDQAATNSGMEGDAGMMFGPVKAAVMTFASSLAQSLAPHVRVNTIAPGWIQTAWGEAADGYWDRRAQDQALMGRWGRPEDVAKAAAYLAAPENDFVTGQVINVNGGWNRRYARS